MKWMNYYLNFKTVSYGIMLRELDNFEITKGRLLLKVVEREKNERQKYVLCLENVQNAQYQPNMYLCKLCR